MVDGVAARVLAAIDETERIATEVQWGYGRILGSVYYSQRGTPVGAFLGLNGPEEVLTRCAADRRTVERHIAIYPLYGAPYCVCCLEYPPSLTTVQRAEWPCPDLRDRAAAYGITEEAAP